MRKLVLFSLIVLSAVIAVISFAGCGAKNQGKGPSMMMMGTNEPPVDTNIGGPGRAVTTNVD